jgi:hypothetical protein
MGITYVLGVLDVGAIFAAGNLGSALLGEQLGVLDLCNATASY